MKLVRSPQSMQRLGRQWQAARTQVAFVPTMGYLHAGHISLARRARQAVGRRGKVVVSIYVNPTQFAPTDDLSTYPRDLDGDRKLCAGAGVDVLFHPPDSQIYPPNFSTYVAEEKLARGMEGASRPTHFRGVTTVVAKLFHIVLPTVAVFGAKDFQQAAVVTKMARDLNFPLKIIVAPTVREGDGLAMSSRNKYLSAQQRGQATILWRAIQQAKGAVGTAPVSAARLKQKLGRLIATQSEARLDYIEFFDPQTLEPVRQVSRGSRMALAVFIGKTRLIDNSAL
ncbi:MAG TPA: pantoate--beta-alanine ligase [Candidatus Baltobacteraceae bacterium]|nr:pantoate--beta-alanine ligase [Candidatus Baltobacteraceae bacterium]